MGRKKLEREDWLGWKEIGECEREGLERVRMMRLEGEIGRDCGVKWEVGDRSVKWVVMKIGEKKKKERGWVVGWSRKGGWGIR
jgi:hypothetical protein